MASGDVHPCMSQKKSALSTRSRRMASTTNDTWIGKRLIRTTFVACKMKFLLRWRRLVCLIERQIGSYHNAPL